jgi:hypothetical protein
MVNRLIPHLGAIAILSVAITVRSAAQIRVELGATVGRYAPLGSFAPTSVYWTRFPTSPSELSGTSLGAQLRVWVTPRVGFQVAGATASSVIGGGFNPGGGFQAPLPARVSEVTAEMLFQVTGSAHRARAWLDAGAAAVRHGGAVYEPAGSPVNIGGVVGIGSAIRITGPLSVNFGVTTLLYGLDVRGPTNTIPPVTEGGAQVDALFQTGLSVSFP